MADAALFWIEIVCGECATTRQGEFVRSRIPVRALKNEAVKDGWMLLSNGDWLCPACKRAAIEAATTHQEPTP